MKIGIWKTLIFYLTQILKLLPMQVQMKEVSPQVQLGGVDSETHLLTPLNQAHLNQRQNNL